MPAKNGVMTQSPLLRARQRAAEKHIAIVAVARSREDNAIVAIITTSHSQPDATHTVRVFSDHLECDCEYYAKTGGVCSHRAVAHDRLLHERAKQAPKETTRVTVNNKPFSIWR